MEEEEEEWEVEKVEGVRIARQGCLQYLVRWKPQNHPKRNKKQQDPEVTWVSEENLNAVELVEEFKQNAKMQFEKVHNGKSIAKITMHKFRNEKLRYRVHWDGLPPAKANWLDESEIFPIELVYDYVLKHRLLVSDKMCFPSAEDLEDEEESAGEAEGSEEGEIEEEETPEIFREDKVERILADRPRGKKKELLVRWKRELDQPDSWVDEALIDCDKLVRQYLDWSREQYNCADNKEYEVEKILHRIKDKYLIRWKGYSEQYDSWELCSELNCPELISEFEERQKKEIAERFCPNLKCSDPTLRDFYTQGYCVLRCSEFFEVQDRLKKCKQRILNHFDQVIRTLIQADRLEELERGFIDFKSRERNRFDFQIPDFTKDHKDYGFLFQKTPWDNVVKEVLGKDCKLVRLGCILNQPESETQKYHVDGDYEPKNLVNVFIPLVDLTAGMSTNGPTELVPFSHLKEFPKEIEKLTSSALFFPTTPLLKAGEALLFDYALYHRGLANRSSSPRPIIYLTYGKKGVDDDFNFSQKRYKHSLPPLPPMTSRKERLNKRRAHSVELKPTQSRKRSKRDASRKSLENVSSTRSRRNSEKATKIQKDSDIDSDIQAAEDEQEEYEVEKIVGCIKTATQVQYQVRWKGWSEEYDEWINAEDMDCEELVNEYEISSRILLRVPFRVSDANSPTGDSQYFVEFDDGFSSLISPEIVSKFSEIRACIPHISQSI